MSIGRKLCVCIWLYTLLYIRKKNNKNIKDRRKDFISPVESITYRKTVHTLFCVNLDTSKLLILEQIKALDKSKTVCETEKHEEHTSA